MQTPLARRLTVGLGVIYAVMGSLEVILKLKEKDPPLGAIAFLGGTLLLGAAILLVGLFAPVPVRFRVPIIIVGAVTGLIATIWTVVIPILAIAVVVLTLRSDGDAIVTNGH